jgi:hypothetical protein
VIFVVFESEVDGAGDGLSFGESAAGVAACEENAEEYAVGDGDDSTGGFSDIASPRVS